MTTKIPRPFPKITLFHPNVGCEFNNRFSAFYTIFKENRNSDMIWFDRFENGSEELVIDSLMHEINHWAYYLYMNKGECSSAFEAFSNSYYKGETPFIEFVNAIPGNYNFTYWNKKYNRNVKCEIDELLIQSESRREE